MNKLFNYNGANVAFYKKEGILYLNATQMSQCFNRQPSDWTKNQQTATFINELAEMRNLRSADLVRVIKGGNNQTQQGTWMHEDVAIEFARWLSPKFAIWCNDRIKELAQYGFTATPHTLEQMINNPDLVIGMAQKLKEEINLRERTQRQLELSNQTIQRQATKVQYYDRILDSSGLISTTLIAKDLGMSANTLNRKLNKKGIIRKAQGVWVPSAKYQNKGYMRSKSYPVTTETGEHKTAIHYYWTEKGREFLFGLFNEQFEITS